MVDLNVRHFCELIRHHDDVLSPMLVSLFLSPNRRTASATVSAPQTLSSAPAVIVGLLARPRLAGVTCAK